MSLDAAKNVVSPANLEAELNRRILQNKDVFDFVHPRSELNAEGKKFIEELEIIDRDIPRCDRDYW